MNSPKYIIHALAGLTAYGRYTRNYFWAYLTSGDADYVKAKASLQQIGHPDELGEFAAVTRKLVNALWPAIDRFAKLLLKRHTIEGQDLDDHLSGLLFGDVLGSRYDQAQGIYNKFLCSRAPCWEWFDREIPAKEATAVS